MNSDENYQKGYQKGASDAIDAREYNVVIEAGTDGMYYARINGYTLAKHEEFERLKYNAGHVLNGFHLRMGMPEIKFVQLKFNLKK